MPTYDRNESIDDIRNYRIGSSTGEQYLGDHFCPDTNTSTDAKAICTTILIAADIIRRSIIASHDSLLTEIRSSRTS